VKARARPRGWPRIAAGVALLLLVALALDGMRPPERQWGAKAAVVAIGLYQATLSRVFAGVGVRCRFEPTCSHYGRAAIRARGLGPGAWLVVKRVARCGPWTPAGTVDPPPGPRG